MVWRSSRGPKALPEPMGSRVPKETPDLPGWMAKMAPQEKEALLEPRVSEVNLDPLASLGPLVNRGWTGKMA